MSLEQDREWLIDEIRQMPHEPECTPMEWCKIILKRFDVWQLESLSSRILVGSRGMDSFPSPHSFETMIGTLYAIRSGFVLYVPSQKVVDEFYGECGFVVPESDFRYDVQTVPKRRGSAHFSAGIYRQGKGMLCGAGYNQPEKEDASTTYGNFVCLSSYRWKHELKPWLDHWLPF